MVWLERKKNFAIHVIVFAKWYCEMKLLPDQGSNLNSSDPESDVLPVTPSGNESAKIVNFECSGSNIELFSFGNDQFFNGRNAFFIRKLSPIDPRPQMA